MVASAGEPIPKEGTYYKFDQLGIRKKEVKGDRIDLVFKPMDEQFFWCPGIRVQTTKVATVVTFVRCETSKTCGVDAKAAIGKRLIRTVSINSNGKDIYVRNGPKRFKRLYKAPKSKTKLTAGGKSKPQGNRNTDAQNASTKAAQLRIRSTLHPQRQYVPLREIKNYRIERPVSR